MATKKAADLKRGDAVILPEPIGRRVAEAIEWRDEFIASGGTQGVRVHFLGLSRWYLLAADKDVTLEGR